MLNQFAARLPCVGPVAFLHAINGCGHGEQGGDIPSAPVLMLVDQGRCRRFPAQPASDERFQERLHLAARPQEARSPGGHHPLVAVARAKVGPQRLQLQGDLSRGVCAIDDRDDPRGPRTADEFFHGECQRGREMM